MGKYHPHGDQSIYDAMVRMAQDFAARYPLVEGQGNFGNIDGDNPAAMRYTEARLTEVARAMLAGIDEDAVDFRPTYDGEESEPIVLPGAFPNLLANGAAGIAVGMATSIPPHNAGEVCAAAMHLIANPKASVADLLAHMPGPDFPTGGMLAEDPASLLAAYETGRGGFRLRAKWEVEKGKHGTWQIVVTEIPYQVQKAKLIEQIAQLMEDKKLPLLGDVRDESSDIIRLVLEPKTRGVEPEVLMETVFRATALETRFPLNMNVLDATRTPRVMSLKEVLQAWLDHRHEVLVRRSNHRLAAIDRRIEVLEGYLLVYLNLDEVIRIIREEDEPKPAAGGALYPDRYAGRGDPEHAAAQPAPPGGNGNPQRARQTHQGAQGIACSAGQRQGTVEADFRRAGDIRKKFGSGPLGDRGPSWAWRRPPPISRSRRSWSVSRSP
jgi:topoisomerase-4 subunit A